ncbi:L-glutamate gamma-semialdehyde dehydrogenase [Virgibacillus profundi]|uniref:L-glutamate gamma-semialdehyde dehydrogenase n=1 Tax=Virgibacillus profundi TaxID=2024555 RepID=A0A2A2IB90_9BACI|nr:L-glutamate gamma-semialdehyde dehydrogenase [Virgibacillus profundi]PAV28390.1 L-glutamate gamma-semialdehyde dehydrogenase [Virgibacillus profundi]PXY52248.1 L-glutamate gamma-semialdehyde dehydrogenase [Virgibacillus profundi]
MLTPYNHEPFTDFTVEENRKEVVTGLEKIQPKLGKNYDLLIGGERVSTDEKIISYNPGNKEEVIGIVSKANQKIAENAIQEADQAFQTWRYTNAVDRANILLRAAAIIRRRKNEFTAFLIKEAGKPWREADADIAEGIDFMEYYARQMIELDKGKEINSRPGEYNRYLYIPTGIAVTIPPWNFAFAIMVGTTVAPLVTGNTVILKPASATPVVAAKFVEVLQKAGVPNGVINFLPGSGAEVGDYLVDHPKTALITFTGSREVGTRLYERAAVLQKEQNHLKRVIVEMGGKDTVVVDSEANIDIAVEAIVTSAFGFSGQKCSAGSRVVVHENVYDEVLEKVVKRTNELTVGETTSNDIYMGPVIDESAYNKIMKYTEIGKEEGRLVAGGVGDDSKGYFIQPTIFAEVDVKARIMQEEIFGPVVAFAKAKDFEHALEIANNSEYGLTGAVITENRHHINKASQEFHVGNLYFNRNCTGAIVGYQPFGGFKMSGTDSKAGGPDYLALHMMAKTISETY